MPISIDNLINVNFTKGRIDLLKFGPKLGGYGEHKPYLPLFFRSGAEAPQVGSVYIASGGTGPYQYTISSGAIDIDTGEIESLSLTDDTGIVTVIDAFSHVSTIQVFFRCFWVVSDIPNSRQSLYTKNMQLFIPREG